MTDIIGQGDDDGPAGRRGGPWHAARSRPAVAVVALVALCALALLGVRLTGQRTDVHPAAASPVPRPPRSAAASPAVSGLPVQAGPVRLSLLTAGSELGWLATDSGQVSPINGVPPEASFADVAVRLANGTVVLSSPVPLCQTCHAVSGSAYYVPDASPRAVRIGAASWLAPGTDNRSVWVIGYGERGAPAAGLRLRQARLVNGGGRPVGPAVTLPAGTALYRGTHAGLLLRTENGGWEIWNPADGTVRARFPHVVAASADDIAWVSGKRTFLTGLATGRTLPLGVTAPSTAAVNFAAFSPDGRRLAIAVTQYLSAEAYASVVSNTIVVADTTSGHLTDVPLSTGFISANLSALGWTPDGRWLLLPTGEDTSQTQLYAWRAGTLSLLTGLDNQPWLPVMVGPPPIW
jgi:hypothetical protein